MNGDPQKRAQRLLHWYPGSWRRRFGDEFAALMEDELAERPHNSRRTLDVIRTGLTARGCDLGIAGVPVDSARRAGAGLASTTVVGALFAMAALHPWAFAMLAWNGWSPQHAGVLQTATTGTMTFALLGLVGVLTVGLVVLVALGLGRAVRQREWRVGLPLLVIGGGVCLATMTTGRLLRFTVASGGIQWGHPGIALKQLAGAVYFTIISMTGTTFSGHTSLTSDLWNVAPAVGIVAVAVSAAFLIRRLPLGPRSERLVRALTLCLSALMLLMVVSYAMWFLGAHVHVFGGNNSFELVAFLIMLVAGTLALACARSTALPRRIDASQ
jgi:hypothetical protein